VISGGRILGNMSCGT